MVGGHRTLKWEQHEGGDNLIASGSKHGMFAHISADTHEERDYSQKQGFALILKT